MITNVRFREGIMKILLSLALVVSLFITHPLLAGEPTEQLRATLEGVVTVLNEAPRSEGNQKEWPDQLRRLIYARFDFLEMAKRSLGAHWKALSAREQKEFAQLFSGLLETASTSIIDTYNAAKTHYKREVQEDAYARVETKVVTKKGDEVAVDYNLQLVNGDWKVYDVLVDNISMVNNYRSQFTRVIAQSSFQDLVRRIKAKQSQALTMKRAGFSNPAALGPRNIRNDSRPLILVTLIGSSNDGQWVPRP